MGIALAVRAGVGYQQRGLASALALEEWRRMRIAKECVVHAKASEFEQLRSRLDETEGALRPALEPAIQNWRAAAAELKGLLANERKVLEETRDELVALQSRVEGRFEEVEALTDMVSGYGNLSPVVGTSDGNRANPELQRKLDTSTRELATLSRLLRTAEDRAQWLAQINITLMRCPSWWRFMPARWQERKQAERLRRKGLFDGKAYLERYPDVAQAAMDPLQHYIAHGQAEGRLR